MTYYFPGMIVGFVLLQTAFIAPTLFKQLDSVQFGTTIRAVWPKFFIGLTVMGLGSIALLFWSDSGTLAHFLIAGNSVLSPLICYAIIPATNRARDEKNDSKFALLHKISVVLTVVVLISNIGVLFL